MRFKAIVNYLIKEIDDGNIKSGNRMPSIRKICDKFNCAKSTALRAYHELKDKGLVYTVPGSGYYLIDEIIKNKNDDNIIDLSGSQLDEKVIPYGDFEACLDKAIDKYKSDLFTYTNPQGLQTLIDVLVKHLQTGQVFTNRDNVFMTTGSQQALNILSRIPFPNGDEQIVIEQPTYLGMVQSLALNKIVGIGVKRDFDGLDFAHLEKIFRKDKVKFFYTVSRFSNPLGFNYTRDEKERLVYLADKYDVYIVEDDYLGDFEYDTKSDPIYSYDMSDRVVYVKTFSRILLPGLRVAVVVLPDLLKETFQEYKYYSDFSTPVLSQGALEIYISSGLYDIHIQKVRKIYLKRMECLRKAVVENESPVIMWHIPEKGMFYVGLVLLNNCTANEIIKELFKNNIILTSMDKYSLSEFYNNKYLRISIANVDCSQIKKVVPIIKGTIEE